jgi:predicted Zn-dependent protease
MADRYLYIPLVGPLVLVAWGAKALAARVPRLGPALPVAAVLAIAACTALTMRRVPTFHDELSLWADWALTTPYISADQPYNAPPRLGEKRLLREALERDGSSGPLHNNIGAIAFEEGRIPEAITELTRARMLAPRDPAIALNLGRAYLLARQPEAAARTLEDAVRLEPPSYYAHLNLARAYIVLGDAPRARAALARARAIRPQWADLRGVDAALARLERGAAPVGGGS